MLRPLVASGQKGTLVAWGHSELGTWNFQAVSHSDNSLSPGLLSFQDLALYQVPKAQRRVRVSKLRPEIKCKRWH